MPGAVYFNCVLEGFELDARTFSDDLSKDIQRQMLNAGKEFVKAAKFKVPVWTGFARGAYYNLQQAVGIKEDIPQIRGENVKLQKLFKAIKGFDIAKRQRVLHEFFKRASTIKSFRRLSVADKPTKFGIPLEYYKGSGGKVLKTPQSGRQFATPQGLIFKKSGFTFTFHFEINISYFNINDLNENPRNMGTPWRSMQRGREAFDKYMEKNALNFLGAINNYVKDVKFSVSNGFKTRTVAVSRSNIIQIKK